jgi:peptide/nickel transport system substrate-binding protein
VTQYAPERSIPLAKDAQRSSKSRYGPGSRAAKAGRQQYFVNRLPAVDHLSLNASRGLFSSARMRKAVNYAIDRRALAWQGGISNSLAAKPTDQYLPPGMPGFREAAIYPSTPDLAKARRLAGREPRRAVLYALDHDPSPQLAQIVKANLGAIGIDVEVKVLPDPVLFEKTQRKGDPFDIAIEAWYADYADPDNFLMLFDGRSIKRTENFNDAYFDEPAFNRSLDAAKALSGPRRYIAYGRLDVDLARREAPWAAFSNETAHDLFSARMGCQVYQPLYGMDLASLCIRR